MKDPYEILGVGKNASDAEIKAAYRKQVLKYHPDKNAGDKAAEEKFKEINNAFDVLKDPQKKAAYDRYGAAAFGAGNGASAGTGANPFGGGNFGGGFGFDMNDFNMSEMMDEVLRDFGFDMGGHGRGARNTRGRDMLHEVVLDLEDAYSGKTETIRFSSDVRCEKCGGTGTRDGRPAPTCETCGGRGRIRARNGIFMTERPCPDCGGTGRKIRDKCAECDGAGTIHKRREIKIEIPAGVTDGERLRLKGQGEAAPLGGETGDFYIDVRIRPHPIFHRHGADLGMTIKVDFATLTLGGDTEIKTLDGKKLDVKIPAGTQVGERLRVRGKGMPGGDLYLEIETTIPTRLSRRQRQLLEEFQKE